MTSLPDARPVGRFRPLAWLAACFLSISALTRLALLVATGSGVPAAPGAWLYAFGVGLGYDLLAFVYFAWPLVLLLWLLPAGWLLRRRGRLAVGALCLLLLFVLLFVAVAEWTFWDEFQARFNFIAVDYLVYTTEVIGNIRQSYPVGWILTAVATLALATFLASGRWRRVARDDAGFAARSVVVLAWLAASLLATGLVSGEMKDRSGNAYVNELAGNGIYQFFAAYRSASLDYAALLPHGADRRSLGAGARAGRHARRHLLRTHRHRPPHPQRRARAAHERGADQRGEPVRGVLRQLWPQGFADPEPGRADPATACCSPTCGPPARAPCAGSRRCRCRCRPRRANPSSAASTTRAWSRWARCSAARATTRSSCTAATARSTT